MNIFIFFGITFACGFFENFISNANPLPYEAIFNFGDSVSDTGNAAFDYPEIWVLMVQRTLNMHRDACQMDA